MHTVGSRWPRSAPRGDYQARCDYCGVHWRRSQLRRDGAGLLSCPDEGPGLTSVELARAELMNARDAVPRQWPHDGGSVDSASEILSGYTWPSPLERFGARLAGWYSTGSEYVTESGGSVTLLRNRSSYGNDATGGVGGFYRPTLETDSTLGVQVMNIDGLAAATAHTPRRAVPVSTFVTMRTPTSLGGDVTLTGAITVSGTASRLRIDDGGLVARYQLLDDGTSTESDVTSPSSGWHVHAIVWVDTGVCLYTVDGVEVDRVAAPTTVYAPTQYDLAAVIATTTAAALEWCFVTGYVTEIEALEQYRYMAQSGGLV
jgi:hypothetical protein